MERGMTDRKVALMQEIGVPYLEVFEGDGTAVLLRAMMASALGERAISRGDEVILVGASCAAEMAALTALGVVGVCIPADSGAKELDGALSPASKAVWVCTDATAEAVCTVRNFCNSFELWMLASVTERDTRACSFDGKRYHVGAVADVAAGTAEADVARAFACTKDALPYRLIQSTLKERK